jgi:glycosyltransferase involved in cell wall biosynthesis
MKTKKDNNLELSIVIPAYNEEENIEKTILNARNAGEKFFGDFEIIIVDDFSKDDTSFIVKRLLKKHPEIILISHEKNKGKAAALNTGFEAAKGKYIFYTDADNQYSMESIKGLKKLIAKADVVSGFRVNKAISPFRKLASDLYNILARVFLGIKAKDVECAFKLFRSEQLKRIRIESSNFMVETEILAKATKLGFSIVDFPVRHYPRTGGETSVNPLRDAFRSVKGLLYLKWTVS